MDKGTPESRKAASINGFINEFAGSFVLFFAALGLTKNFFGAEVASLAQKAATEQGAMFDGTSTAAKIYASITSACPWLGNCSPSARILGYGFSNFSWRSYWSWFEPST